MTNRALVLAALADGTTTISGALRSRDTQLMAGALRALGIRIGELDEAAVTVSGGGPLRPTVDAIDVGNAGTVARFLPPLAGLADGPLRLDGDPRVRQRPLGPLVAALRTLGVRIDDGDRGGLPLTVHGTGRVTGGPVGIDASASSQFVSGLLLAASRFDQGVVVEHRGGRLPSRPHLAMTLDMLRDFGADVDQPAADRWRVGPGPLRRDRVTVEPDLSSAAPFLAAALVTGGQVTISGWPVSTHQPGARWTELLTELGGQVRLDGAGLTVSGGGSIRGIDVDLADASELAPVLAALAALADGPSRLRGIAHMRGHETDRLAALAREIGRLGGRVEEHPDGLSIDPRPLRGGIVATYDDHRLAMAFAVLGLAVDGVHVENIETTVKTLPGFPRLWAEMLAA